MRWIGIGIIGLLGGWVSGLFGVGGGVLFVPLSVLFLKMDIHLAIGTSLAAIIPTAFVGAFRYFSADSVDWRMALLLAVFAMFGAWLGSGLSLQIQTGLLRKIFGAFLMVLALRLFFKS